MADQREDLYATRLTFTQPRPNNTIDLLRTQHAKLEMRGITPIGISISIDLLMCEYAQHEMVDCADGGRKLLGLPLTIISDKNGVIAWSLQL